MSMMAMMTMTMIVMVVLLSGEYAAAPLSVSSDNSGLGTVGSHYSHTGSITDWAQCASDGDD